MGGRKPSVSRFDTRKGGGARESPPSCRNMRRRVGGSQEAPLSHTSTRGRVCGCVGGMWGMGGDTWQGGRQEFDTMAHRILGRTHHSSSCVSINAIHSCLISIFII